MTVAKHVVHPFLKVQVADMLACLAPLLKVAASKKGEAVISYSAERIEIGANEVMVSAPAEGVWPDEAHVGRRFLDVVKMALKIAPPEDMLTLYGREKQIQIGNMTVSCTWHPRQEFKNEQQDISLPFPSSHELLAAELGSCLPEPKFSRKTFGIVVEWNASEPAIIAVVSPDFVNIAITKDGKSGVIFKPWKRLCHQIVQELGLDFLIKEAQSEAKRRRGLSDNQLT